MINLVGVIDELLLFSW